MKIKEKVLKKVLEQKWISLDGKLPTENVIKDTINKTIAEVIKVIDGQIRYFSKPETELNKSMVLYLKELKQKLRVK